MAHKLANLVKQTSVSAGSTTIVLSGAPLSPNQAFSDFLADGDTTEVMVVDRRTGAWQAAVYTFAADVLTLVADHFIASWTGSPVTFLPGLKDVYIAPLAEHCRPFLRTADFVAIPRFRYDVDTTDDEVTATIADAADEGAAAVFRDFAGTWGTNNFTIDGNGGQIDDGTGTLTDSVLCSTTGTATLMYARGVWRLSVLSGLTQAGVAPRVSSVVSSGTTTAFPAQVREIIINKDVSAAHAVTLPANPVPFDERIVSDGKGDLDADGGGTIKIRVTGAAGELINGQPYHDMIAAYQSTRYRFSGTQWNIVA